MLRNLLLLLLFSNASFGQALFSISGTVKDKTEVLAGASIYLSGYKITTITNGNGKFTLADLKPGNYDILVQMIGYQPYSKNILITDKSVVVELKLTESTTQLNEVVIKPNPNYARYISLFKEFFIGKTVNASQTQILNTQVLSVDEDIENYSVTIKASDFLLIENQALGYRIKYLLEQFEYNFGTKVLYYAGYSTFEEMKGSNSEQKKWIKNREIAYKGSAQHFFASLFQNKIDEEGFIIYKRYEFPNPKRLPDSVLKANYRKLLVPDKQKKGYRLDTKSYAYTEWQKQNNEPRNTIAIDRSKIYTDTLVNKFNENLKMINFKDDLFVLYKNEKELPDYENSTYYQSRPKDLIGQVSVIKMLRAPIYFYANGVVYNPRSTLYSGYWSYEKMADSVPMDFVISSRPPKK